MSSITFLGTGNAMCTKCYNTCFYLRTPGGGLLTDAGGGNGIFAQLISAGIAYEEIHHIFVTHVHTDHIIGVIWLIRKISPLMHKGKYKGQLHIYCHDEAKHAIETMCELMLPKKIGNAVGENILVEEVKDGDVIKVDDMELTVFDIGIGTTKAKQFGYRARLADGQTLVCLGDEPYNVRNEELVEGCDWMLHEAFCLYADRAQFRPYEKNHSTVLDTGELAQHLGVKNLVLYHTEDTNLDTRKATYTAEAKKHFKGNVYVPDDLETIEL